MPYRRILLGLLAAAICLCGLTACGQSDAAADRDAVAEQTPPPAAAESPALLPPAEFLAAYEAEPAGEALLVDCRTPGEFAGGSLPGAVNVDFRSPRFRESAQALPGGQAVYVFCQAGGRSARAAEVFRELGYRRVVDMEGGYGAYTRQARD